MKSKIYLFLACFLTAFAFNATADRLLRGTAFSDYTKHADMPKGWEEQPVQYTKDVGDADLVVSLGQQTYPALSPIVMQFAKENNIKIVIQSGTCGITAGKLQRKTIDTGAFCCPPGENDRLPGLEFHTIAISPIAIITNQENTLENISLDNARQVFQGKIQEWSDPQLATDYEGSIQPIGRLHCKKRPGHWTLLLSTESEFGPTLTEVGVIPDLISKVGRVENAISIETPFMVNTYGKPGTVKMLKVDNVSPMDLDAVAQGQYPFYRVYSLTTWSSNPGKRDLSLQLIAYLRDYIEREYSQYAFVPVSKLKQYGWKFHGEELVAEPGQKPLAQLPM